MYKNGEVALDRILELVTKCPKEFQEKCFDILMSGYVQMELAGTKPPKEDSKKGGLPLTDQQTLLNETKIPQAVLHRLKNTAKRIAVTQQQIESLFDFDVDPFTFHAVTLPGKKSADKARNVALLAASRSYLATGSWVADWQEVKALCVDHSCYDAANHVTNLKNGVTSLFKKIEARKPIELSSSGVREAEKLLKEISEGPKG